MSVNMKKPFEGLKVVDLTSYIAAPVCGKLLGDWGADVIKVEGLKGEPYRWYGPNCNCPIDDTENPLFDVFNMNKRSIALDLRTPEGMDVLMRLLAEADVFITSNRVNALKKMGIDYEQIKDRFPRLIYATITGFGETGPDKDLPGHDTVAFWGRPGFLADFADPSGYPVSPPAGMGDNITGTTLFGGICAALYAREKTGRGDKVTASLYGTALWLAAMPLIANHAQYGDYNPKPRYSGNPFICFYQCSDGEWMVISIVLEKDYQNFCNAMGLQDMLADERFAQRLSCFDHREEVIKRFEAAIAQKSSTELDELLKSLDIIHNKLGHYRDVVEDEQALANDFLRKFTFESGTEISMPVFSVKSRNIGDYHLTRGPLLGEHTDEILTQLGYTAEEIAAMKEKAACAQK